MKAFMTALLIALLFSCTPPTAHAEVTSSDRTALLEWVRDNAIVKLSDNKIKKMVSAAWASAHLNGLNPMLILSVIKVESGFKESSKSSYGATGLMQVVPRFHQDKLQGRNPMDASTSIEVGTQILRECWDRNKRNMYKTLSCYSGGGGSKYHQKVMLHKRDMENFVEQKENDNESNVIETNDDIKALTTFSDA